MSRKLIKLTDNTPNAECQIDKKPKWSFGEISLNKDFNKEIALLSAKINALLQDEKFIEANVHLFGKKEYDHNTRDVFLEVLPVNDNKLHLKTGNLIGYVSSGNLEVHIGSRFGDWFLRKMIQYAEGFLEVPDSGSISKNDGITEWIAVYLWKYALKKAYRLGLPKAYVGKNERLTKIRGNIDINDFVNKNGRDGKYLCNYREHNYNNHVNQLIHFTYEKLDKKHRSLIKDTLRMRQTFAYAVHGKKTKLQDALRTKKLSNPYYHDYNNVVELSKKILRNQFSGIGGQTSDMSAFLFDVSMLFEFFIRRILTRGGFDLFPSNPEDLMIPRGNGNDRHLYPDIIIKHDDAISVFDVKYKRFDFTYGIKREDIFQLHTYVGNLLNSHDIRSCGFIIPIEEKKIYDSNEELKKQIKDKGFIKQSIKINNKEIPFYVFFFKVPYIEEENFKGGNGKTNTKDKGSNQILEKINNFTKTFQEQIETH